MLEKFKNLDRRWVFLFVFLAVLIPLLMKLGMKIHTTEPVENIYNFINNLPEGSVVLISFDYGPSTETELSPAAVALVRHCFKRKLKIVTLALWPMGAQMSQNVMAKVAKMDDINVEYGKDYVNLGYKAGGTVLLMSIKDGFAQQFPEDINGRPVSDLPLMNKVKDYSSCALVTSLSAGVPGIREYIIIVSSQFGRKVAGACTAVTAPEMYTFLNSGQLLGLMGGLKGAAEYEKLTGYEDGTALKGMDAQSVVHAVITLFIIFSNIVYFVDKYRQAQMT